MTASNPTFLGGTWSTIGKVPGSKQAVSRWGLVPPLTDRLQKISMAVVVVDAAEDARGSRRRRGRRMGSVAPPARLPGRLRGACELVNWGGLPSGLPMDQIYISTNPS